MTNKEQVQPTPVESKRDEIGSLSEELRQARLEIVGLRVEASRLALQADDLRRQLKAARSTTERYADQISTLRRSVSWRVTRPLRLFRRRHVENGQSRRAS